MINTLVDILYTERPANIAMIAPEGKAVTYALLRQEVERLAGLLSGLGVKRGESVTIALPNGIEFITCFLAVTACGAVAAPLNCAYTEEEFTFYMEDAESVLAIAPPGTSSCRTAALSLGIAIVDATLEDGKISLRKDGSILRKSIEPESASSEDVALLLHTSGTTSKPKGVPLRHVNIAASLRNIADSYKLSDEDIALIVMPLFHVHGLIGVALSTIATGGTIVVPPRFSAGAFWQICRKTEVTWYSAVPTIHQILLTRADSDGAPHESFRFIRSCSSALAPAILDRLEKRFGAPVVEAYGMTEATHQMSSNPLPPGKREAGSVGQATGMDISIMDMGDSGELLPSGSTGEVVIKGRNVMWGYRNNPQATNEAVKNGWFRTGDQGAISSDGYLTLTGRIKELINRGGEKVSPLEIDAVLLQHPDVAEVVTFAVPDEKYGEAVMAAVVTKCDIEENALREFCREHLADFKVPDNVYITDYIPRTATGKIQRRLVAKHFIEGTRNG